MKCFAAAESKMRQFKLPVVLRKLRGATTNDSVKKKICDMLQSHTFDFEVFKRLQKDVFCLASDNGTMLYGIFVVIKITDKETGNEKIVSSNAVVMVSRCL